jgi:hypothetical protein
MGVVVIGLDQARLLETSLEVFMQTIEQATPEQLAKRKSNLQRKHRQRAREKARSHQAMQAHLERIKGDRMNAEGIARRTKRNQCMFGEVRPGMDAKTIDEALEVAREMARALSISDVQENESLHDFERRVFNAWTNYEGFRGGHNSSDGGGAPYLNRLTGELSPGLGKPYWEEHCGGFDECWQPLPGARKKLDLAALPKLKKLKRPEEPQPEPKAALVPPTPALIPQQQPDAINFTWIPSDAQRFLNGGK